MAIRTLSTTTDFADHIGVNTHFPFPAPTNYQRVSGVPYAPTLNAVKNLNVAVYRERWWGGNPTQNAALNSLSPKKKLYGFPGDIHSSIVDIKDSVKDAWNISNTKGFTPFAALCGPNEPNADGGSAWPGIVLDFVTAVKEEVEAHTWPGGPPLVVGPALKHNGIVNLDDDYEAMGEMNLQDVVDVGDFHFYNAFRGPGYRMDGKDSHGVVPPGVVFGTDGKCSIEHFELQRARRQYHSVSFPMCHSEHGYTSTQKPPTGPTDDDAAWYSQETFLRDYNLGIVYTIIYEAVNEKAPV